MEQIYINLMTPAWWFTGIFFVIVGIVLSLIFKKIPSHLRGFSRNRRAKYLKKIRNIRWSQSEINYEINKANGRFVVFCLFCLTYLGWIAYEPIQKLFSFSIFIGLIFSSPVYIMEASWLLQDSKVKQIIYFQKKLHNKKMKADD